MNKNTFKCEERISAQQMIVNNFTSISTTANISHFQQILSLGYANRTVT